MFKFLMELDMIKKIIIGFALSLLIASCVSQGKYDLMVGERDSMVQKGDSLQKVINALNSRNLELTREVSKLNDELKSLRATYETLKENSSAGAMSMISKLEELQKDIAERESRLEEIKRKLEERDRFLTSLRESIQKAMAGVEEGGLTVYVKDGKLYVSDRKSVV